MVGSSGLTDEEYAEIDRGGARARRRRAGSRQLRAHGGAAPALRGDRGAADPAVGDRRVRARVQARRPFGHGARARRAAVARAAAGDRGARREDARRARGPRGVALGTPVHSVRLPGFVSSIEVLFGLPDERLSIRHDSGSGAEPYIAGTLLAIRRVGGFTGLRRGLDSVMEL